MPSLAGLALRPQERRIAIILLYIWSLPKLFFRIREWRRSVRQRRELETEIGRLRELNQQLETHVSRGFQAEANAAAEAEAAPAPAAQ